MYTKKCQEFLPKGEEEVKSSTDHEN